MKFPPPTGHSIHLSTDWVSKSHVSDVSVSRTDSPDECVCARRIWIFITVATEVSHLKKHRNFFLKEEDIQFQFSE